MCGYNLYWRKVVLKSRVVSLLGCAYTKRNNFFLFRTREVVTLTLQFSQGDVCGHDISPLEACLHLSPSSMVPTFWFRLASSVLSTYNAELAGASSALTLVMGLWVQELRLHDGQIQRIFRLRAAKFEEIIIMLCNLSSSKLWREKAWCCRSMQWSTSEHQFALQTIVVFGVNAA